MSAFTEHWFDPIAVKEQVNSSARTVAEASGDSDYVNFLRNREMILTDTGETWILNDEDMKEKALTLNL